MTRRLALAVALAFTTVVTFALVAIGAQAGLFGGGGKDGAPADAAAGLATPTAEPTVITEYIYVDQTVTPVPSGEPSQGGPGAAASNPGEESESGSGSGASFAESAPAPAGESEHEDEHEDELGGDGEHESEHEEGDD